MTTIRGGDRSRRTPDGFATGDAAGDDTGEQAEAGSGGIDDVRRLRATARRDRQAWPLALVVLGLVVVGGTPFYVYGSPRRFSLQASETLGPLANIGAPFAPLGQWAGLYWVVALVVGILLIALLHRRAAARRGIAGPLWPVVTTGIVMLVALLFLTPRILDLFRPQPVAFLSTGALSAVQTLYFRGLTPLLVIALVVLVLAWTERSVPLAIVAAIYLALALVANLYDMANLGFRTNVMFPGRYDALPNLLVPGVMLLATGIFAALWRRP
jgi:hypothetical protein